MKRKFSISSAAYDFLLEQINKQYSWEIPGALRDMDFIQTDFWLQDTAVIEAVEKNCGLWKVSLVFVHHQNPMKFIKRDIKSYADSRKALIAAHYMRRQAAKDQRGTLVINTQNMVFGNS